MCGRYALTPAPHLPARNPASSLSGGLAQASYFGFQLLDPPVQSLDGHDHYPIGVGDVDHPVVVTEAEGSSEVLSHRTQVTDAGGLKRVAPSANRQCDQGVKDLVAVDRRYEL